MAAFFEILLTFAAVLVFSAALSVKAGLDPGLCPLIVLCATMLWFSAFGCFDLLAVAGWGYFLLAALALGWLAWRRRRLRLRALVTPATLFFLAASLLVMGYFALRQPIPMEWDEFSFWSIAPKVVKLSGRMYTANPGNLRVTSYVPGLVMLDYAFSFFGAGYQPWKIFAAYDILLFACFAAALAPAKRRHWALAAPAAVFCLLLPFLGTVYLKIIYVCTAYMSSYADIPMGVLFGGALALYFNAEKKTPALLWGVAAAVTAVSLTKDTGFALSLIAAALVGFDLLFHRRAQQPAFFGLKGPLVRLCWCGVLAGGPVAAFFGWAAHMRVFTGADRLAVGGAANLGAVQLVATGLKELVGVGRTEHFSAVMGGMLQAYFKTPVSMFQLQEGKGPLGPIANGSGFTVTLVVLGLLAAAFLLDRRGRRQVGWFALLSFAGFWAYYCFIGFTYVYVFPAAQGLGLVSYNRYIYCYYLGWLLAAMAFLLRSCCRCEEAAAQAFALPAAPAQAAPPAPGPKPAPAGQAVQAGQPAAPAPAAPPAGAERAAPRRGEKGEKPPRRWAAPLGRLLLLAVCGACLWRWCTLVRPQMSVLDYPESYFSGMRRTLARAQRACSCLDEDSRVFYVKMDDDGMGWFIHYYAFYPVLMDYSFGGGGLGSYREITGLALPPFFTGEERGYFEGKTITKEVLCRYLEAAGCTHLYLDHIDPGFRADFGELFTDGLAAFDGDGVRLYAIQYRPGGLQLAPVAESGGAQ